jgi:OCT family organic cation transporter-like MFS transporter 4/5
MLGCVSGLFVGYFGDKFGRKRTSFVLLCLSSITMIVTQVLLIDKINISITGKYIIYSISQFFIGGLVNSVYSTAYVLLLKITTNKYKTLFSNIMLFNYVLGELFILLIAYFIRNWQIINFIIAGLTTIVTILFFFLVEESPKWYVEHKKYEEALKVLQKIAKINNRNLNPYQFQNTIINNKNVHPIASNNKVYSIENLKPVESIVKKVSIKGMLIGILTPKKVFLKTLLIIYIYFASNLLYYGISLGLNNVNAVDPYILYISQALAEIFGYWLCLINYKLGNKKMNIIYLLLASSVCLVISFVPRNKDVKNQNKVLEDNILIISLISIGKLMISASFNTFYIFTNQLYHINDRNFAFLFCTSVGRLGSLISPQINLLGDIIWKPLPFLIFSISAIFAAIFNFLLPEKYI